MKLRMSITLTLLLALSLAAINTYGEPTITHPIYQVWAFNEAPLPSPAHVYLLEPTKADPKPDDRTVCNPVIIQNGGRQGIEK